MAISTARIEHHARRAANKPPGSLGWFGTRASLVRGGAWLPGVIVAQPSALAISVRDSACSSAVSARRRRALPNQGA